jgi:methenyltetrahydromethanopterin cyclohydrolase
MNTNIRTLQFLADQREQLEQMGVKATEFDGALGFEFAHAASMHQENVGIILGKISTANEIIANRERTKKLVADGESVASVHASMDSVLKTGMGCQYGGWLVMPEGKWFGMGSGPMRRVRLKPDPLFEDFPELLEEQGDEKCAVGVIETGQPLTREIFAHISEETGVPLDSIALCTAPADSIAGCWQVAIRVVETAGHIAHLVNEQDDEIKIDLRRWRGGMGSAIVAPPTPGDENKSMIDQNKAIAMCGDVTIVIDVESQQELDNIAVQLVFSTHFPGQTFQQVLDDNGGNLGKMFTECPQAFAPARVELKSTCRNFKSTAGKVDFEGLGREWKADGLI